MVTVLCAFVCAAALLSALAFGGDTALSLLAAGAAVGIALLDFFLGRKKAWARCVLAVLGAGLLCFCFYIPTRASDYGYEDYLAKSADYMGALVREDAQGAEALRAEIVEKYGDSDDLRFLAANAALAAEDLEEAARITDSFQDQHSKICYVLREQLLLLREMDAGTKKDQLLELYLNAAADNPGWVYVLQNAGGMLFDRGRYAEASYYLLNALACGDGTDPVTLYYMGACLMEQGEYQKGLYYFRQAVDAGAEDEIIRGIAWYAEKAGIEVKQK